MGSLGQVEHVDLVGDGLAHRTGQLHRRLLEFLRVEHRLHRHNALLGVWHLDADGATSWDRRNDTDALSGEAQSNVVLQVTYLGDANTLGRCNLIERDSGAYGGLDARNLYAKGTQHLHDAVLVGRLLSHIDIGLAVVVVMLQQVERGIVVVLQVALGVVGFQVLLAHADEVLAVGLLLLRASLHI